jgi:hypothetical protein
MTEVRVHSYNAPIIAGLVDDDTEDREDLIGALDFMWGWYDPHRAGDQDATAVLRLDKMNYYQWASFAGSPAILASNANFGGRRALDHTADSAASVKLNGIAPTSAFGICVVVDIPSGYPADTTTRYLVVQQSGSTTGLHAALALNGRKPRLTPNFTASGTQFVQALNNLSDGRHVIVAGHDPSTFYSDIWVDGVPVAGGTTTTANDATGCFWRIGATNNNGAPVLFGDVILGSKRFSIVPGAVSKLTGYTALTS